MPKSVKNTALVLIAVFLCFGYTTGTDWYNYELFYNNVKLSEETAKSREFGYFLLQNFAIKLGFDFWIFHITLKVLVFAALIYFIRYFKVNVFLFLAIFIADIGLYLFIDCPFRNLIALGFSLIAITKLFDNKPVSYFIFVFLAVNFHVSAIIMVLVYFIYKKNIQTLFVLIAAVLIYTISFNIDFLITKIYLPLANASPIIAERLGSYFNDSRFIADKINTGTIIRLFVLFILLLFKQRIIESDDKKALYIYSISILLLLIYPLGISMKILQRFVLFLFPFYTLGILYLLKSLKIKTNLYLIGSFFVLLSFLQTYNTITTDFRYVPYTNYLYSHVIKRESPSMEYRYQYNRKHSPYKK
jgi:hypothetical protein